MFHPKAAAYSAKVVVDSAADRLNVFVKQPAAQDDDDMDTQMAGAGSAIATRFFGAEPDAYAADVTPAAHTDIWDHVYDSHTPFA